jgi:hypothetical protein
MTLTADERESLMAEVADPRRREVLARFSRRTHQLSPTQWLEFLAAAARLLEPLRALPRRRPIPGGQYLL